jgi:hypothetical protein
MLARGSRSRVAVLLLLALTGCQRPTNGPTTSDSHASAPTKLTAVDQSNDGAFTASVAELFREHSDRVQVTVLEPLTLKLAVVGTDKKDLRVSLHRMWGGCQADPAGCDATVRDFVAKSVLSVATPEQPITPDEIVAVLRPRGYFDAMGDRQRPTFSPNRSWTTSTSCTWWTCPRRSGPSLQPI